MLRHPALSLTLATVVPMAAQSDEIPMDGSLHFFVLAGHGIEPVSLPGDNPAEGAVQGLGELDGSSQLGLHAVQFDIFQEVDIESGQL